MPVYVYIHVSQEKSRFNFWHNFADCWDIFTIFEAPCSGLISAWYSLLHTHHRCEAVAWCDVTHDISQAVACSVHWHQTSYHLLMALNSLDVNPVDSSFSSIMQEKVYQTHSDGRVETLAGSRVNRAGSQSLSQCMWHVCESWRGIFWTTFVLNLQVALWSVCWIVGLCSH